MNMWAQNKLHLVLLLAAMGPMTWSEQTGGLAKERTKREPLQNDEAAVRSSGGVSAGGKVLLTLSPEDSADLVEGEDITFNCKITNKPQNSQVQWYYMIRNPVDNTFDNFTILANEVATVDPNRYSVWTTPPNLFSLKVKDMTPNDSGEYCCFLYVSYSETYRETTAVRVSDKRPPPTTTPGALRSGSGRASYGYGRNSRRPGTGYGTNPRTEANNKIEEIIEEVVEHDIEAELGRTLNITMIKSNAEARTLIHNATEEIKSLLNVNENSGMEFNNGTTKLTVTRKMAGVSSQVKTVVTTLISRISNVDATLAQALTPLHKPNSRTGQADYASRAGASYAARPPNAVPDWRKLYNEYKKENGASSQPATNSVENTIPERPGYNRIPDTLPVRGADEVGSVDVSQQEFDEEQNNVIESGTPERGTPERGTPERGAIKQTGDTDHSFSGKKCEYQIVINEFDPSQCPSLGSAGSHGAQMYYEGNNKHAAAFTEVPIGNAQPPPSTSNEQLNRLEDRLIAEMANSQMVNKTVLMHDSMLGKTEKMLEIQNGNMAKLEEEVKSLQGQVAKSEQEKNDMEDKLTEVMLNMLEVNKRLDVAMKKKGTSHYDKEIGVLSASETVTCDRHPNVTHYQDCSEIAAETNGESGVYYIRPLYSACPIPVWCDMDTYPGGWTMVQKREGGKVTFNREWAAYRKGFGQVTGEHWLGNDNLFLLSNQDEYMMRVDMWDFYDSRVYSEYRTFKIDGERDGYKLTVGNYSGTAGDGLKSHNKQKFSTSDKDNDMWNDYHCAYEWEGGWWFTNCWSSYLNGKYYNVSNPSYNGISWREWKEEQLYRSEIKIRPVYYVRSDAPADEATDEKVALELESSEEQGDYQRDQGQNRHRPLQKRV